MKLRIRNGFGVPMNLQGIDSIKLQFPYEGGKMLEKNSAKILDAGDGKIELDLSDFEIQGLQVGKDQNILGEVIVGDDVYHVLWRKALHVGIENDRKVLQ